MYVSGVKVYHSGSPFVKIRYLNRLLTHRAQYDQALQGARKLQTRDKLDERHLEQIIGHIDSCIKTEIAI